MAVECKAVSKKVVNDFYNQKRPIQLPPCREFDVGKKGVCLGKATELKSKEGVLVTGPKLSEYPDAKRYFLCVPADTRYAKL